MKRVIYLLIFAGVLLTACKKDEPGGTATQALAGEWVVIADGVDADGNLVVKDPDAMGKTMFYTYNTAANISTEMYVDDLGNFRRYKVRVKSDVNALTFNTEGAVANEATTGNVTIEGGKVIPKGTRSPHGTIVDSIVFYVNFEGDPLSPATYAKLRVAGFRYTGLAEDELDL